MSNPYRSFDEICEAGRIAREQGDDSRWQLGDLATEIETRYGADLLGDFAREVMVAKKTVQEYRRMSAFYPKVERDAFTDTHPNIAYSHMRVALRLKDPLLAYQFLEQVADQTWSVDQAARELALRDTTPKPEKVLAGVVVVIRGAKENVVELALSYDAIDAIFDNFDRRSHGQYELTLVWRPPLYGPADVQAAVVPQKSPQGAALLEQLA